MVNEVIHVCTALPYGESARKHCYTAKVANDGMQLMQISSANINRIIRPIKKKSLDK